MVLMEELMLAVVRVSLPVAVTIILRPVLQDQAVIAVVVSIRLLGVSEIEKCTVVTVII